jgi:ureidoacrylate peracid hydrolase
MGGRDRWRTPGKDDGRVVAGSLGVAGHGTHLLHHGIRRDRMIRDPALVLVDLQRDFVDLPPESDADPSAFAGALAAAADFLDRYRETGRTPILVRTTHDEHSNSPAWTEKYAGRDRKMPCETGTEGAAFADELPVESGDVVVTKHRYSAFHETDLETYLRSNDVSRVLVGGVNTNVCVAATVIDAFDRDYHVTVLEDCTASTEPELHESMLENVASNFGTVCRSDEVDL